MTEKITVENEQIKNFCTFFHKNKLFKNNKADIV